MNSQPLQNKVAIITGGSRGLGLSIAQHYAKAGASVVIASRSQRSVDEAVLMIESLGGQAVGLAVDVADLNQVKALRDLAFSKYGKLDIWVNNAGVAGPYGPTISQSPEEFTQVVQTNILGVYHGSLVAMTTFKQQNSGKLINILGRGYNGPVEWQNAYASSKAWVNSFTRALAAENKTSAIGVFAFNPGMVLTELLTNVDVIAGSEHHLTAFPKVVRMWAKPANVPAEKAVWLASSATDAKTGLVVSMFSAWVLIDGLVREVFRSIRGRTPAANEISMTVIPPYKFQ